MQATFWFDGQWTDEAPKLTGPADHKLSAHRSPACNIHSERLPIEIFHYDKFPALVYVDIVNRANIGMVQRRSGSSLAAKPL